MPELRTISIYESQKIQLDENNKLYWDGKPLVTEERLVFQKRINWAIYLSAISTAVYALIEVLKYTDCKF